MNDKEEFLAFLKQASATVDKWPAWKKSGLNAPEAASRTEEIVKQYLTQPQNAVNALIQK
ncbi:hypothetical protein [Pantoea ananatis]|uniref:hypothetical protein n=1 Tax=Pantoea ananas TaxID=553 RepID=UPI000F889FE0|nr:hypothetical protein [Pantoea ananatis]RQN05723.1 hypothetical protein EHQ51_13070 [Pantoea ananatis]